MKLKGISLLLLVCYLAILSHNMVPHVHHSECRVKLSLHHANQEVHHSAATHSENSASDIEKCPHPHSHHSHDHHHHGSQHTHNHDEHTNLALQQHSNAATFSEKPAINLLTLPYEHGNHGHGFPLHHHVSPDNEFDYLRLKTAFSASSSGSPLPAFYALLQPLRNELLPPKPVIRYFDYPFLISSSLFEPGATGMRGPPSIA